MTITTEKPLVDGGIQVAAFYKFVPLNNIEGLQQELRQVCTDSGLLGTILLAAEGINGTIAGTVDGVDRLFRCLRGYPGLADLGNRISYCNRNPFYRMKV